MKIISNLIQAINLSVESLIYWSDTDRPPESRQLKNVDLPETEKVLATKLVRTDTDIWEVSEIQRGEDRLVLRKNLRTGKSTTAVGDLDEVINKILGVDRIYARLNKDRLNSRWLPTVQ